MSRNARSKIEYVAKQCGEILHIFDPVYRQNYYYFNCRSQKDYTSLLKLKFKIELTPKDTDGAFNVFAQRGTDVCFLWTKGKTPQLVAHEVFHAVSYILRRKGLPLSDDTEEAYAYLIQFLTTEILKHGKF
jgi:hypothetical protein